MVGRRLPTSFVPAEDYGYMMINIQLPPAASLERTDVVTKQVDAILLDTPGIEAFTTIGGFNLSNRVSASNNAFYFVGLKPWSERDGRGLQAPELVAKLNARFRREIPPATVFANMPPSIPGLGSQGGFSFWLQDVSIATRC